ncbi:MarR family winged helix-turn-helix transcriptional regulator [Streptomyces sp. NPDC046870]|uniref:MarR family winged helix-turn-helix transcriptional regulator n=1 Tax=Streptomyces sp. NPDC046870 TaxID=3155135 RepID=UPI003452DCCA
MCQPLDEGDVTNESPRWLTETEEQAWRGLLRVFEQLVTRTGRPLQSLFGLSAADYTVLAELTRVPEGRLRVLELGKVVGWERSRVSHHVARMSKRGLVERQGCAYDRRGVYVSVTPLGRRAIEEAAPRHVEDVRGLFLDHLTAAQIALLAEVSDELADSLAQTPEVA